MFRNIPNSDNFKKIEKLSHGWSKDQKYYISTFDNQEYLLRISDASLYEKRKKQFEYLKELEKLDLPLPKPIDFGYLNDNEIYMLLSYIKGVPADEYIKMATDEESYRLGYDAGLILNKIHSINITNPNITWNEAYLLKIDKKIKFVNESIIKYKEKDFLIDYINKHLYLVKNRPYTFCHGDYHLGNMIVNNHKIYIIDFDKSGPADPYDEFKPFIWNTKINKQFENGLINGYFKDNVPNDFFEVLALYTAESQISHLPWALTFGEEEIRIGFENLKIILDDYDNFKLVIPKWYGGKNDNLN